MTLKELLDAGHARLLTYGECGQRNSVGLERVWVFVRDGHQPKMFKLDDYRPFYADDWCMPDGTFAKYYEMELKP